VDDLSFTAEALALGAALRARGWRVASAESCTGGLIAAACTAVAGSSDWFERGVVSYSNAAKTDLLGVAPALIAEHGAVSEAVARAMAQGLLQRAPVQLAVAVTGIAGPGGGQAGRHGLAGAGRRGWRAAVHRTLAAGWRPQRRARSHRAPGPAAHARGSGAGLRPGPSCIRVHR
jgi:PncC family amidohydrolase